MRQENPALSHGDFNILDVSVTENTFGFIRAVDNQKLLVLFNRAHSEENIELISDKDLKDIFGGRKFESVNGRVHVKLMPQSFLALE